MTVPIELVIFDCDGVLIDSEVLSMGVWQQLLSEHNVTITRDYFTKQFLGKSMAHVVASVKADFAIALSESDLSHFNQSLADAFSSALRPTDGVHNVLTSLKVPFCLATSSSPERTELALACTGLAPFFINNRFTRSMVDRGKPAPDLFLFAAKSMGVSAERCLVIEDSEAGMQAAKGANMRALRFVGGSHFNTPTDPQNSVIVSWTMFKECYAELFDQNSNSDLL